METKTILEKLEASKEFTEWKKDNPDTYLVHFFKMLDKENVNEWQIGFYNSNKRMITTFVFNENSSNC